MQEDSLKYDSLAARPLPKWLTDQKAGLTAAQPPKDVIRKDRSLDISFALTGIFVLLLVIFLTVLIIRKQKK
jgi:lipopolysaccharide/colanic/teichoic acid biosynthesis glycosyltransferase